jgi:dihydroorotase
MGSSTGPLLVEDDEGVRNILKVIRRRVSFHSEDEYRLDERKHLRVPGEPRSHPVWRDDITALTCTQRLVRLARETGKRVHVLHISTGQEMEFLRHHKDVASVEATPHHLTLAAPDCYEQLGARAQMNPPVRDRSHREIRSGAASRRASSTCSAPIMRPTPRKRNPRPIRQRPRE